MWQIKGKYEASWVHATELMKEREEKLDRAGRRGWAEGIKEHRSIHSA